MSRLNLTVRKRHGRKLPCNKKGGYYFRCDCPLIIDGNIDGESLKNPIAAGKYGATTKEAAEALARTWTERGYIDLPEQVQAVQNNVLGACQRFLDSLRAKNVAKATYKKYRNVVDQFVAYCALNGVEHLKQVTAITTERFVQSWKDSPLSAGKKLERLRGLFSYFETHELIAKNYARAIKRPQVGKDVKPNPRYSEAELDQIFAGCRAMESTVYAVGGNKGSFTNMHLRLEALCLTMLYTGLRISDAVALSSDHIQGNTVILNMFKTGDKVEVPVPELLVAKLAECPMIQPPYRWFWTGEGSRETVAGNYRRALRQMVETAGLKFRVNPHRFRDTFAMRYLELGVSMDHVAVLLGHRSPEITRKYYAQWAPKRQELLNAIVEQAMAKDGRLKPVVVGKKIVRMKWGGTDG